MLALKVIHALKAFLMKCYVSTVDVVVVTLKHHVYVNVIHMIVVVVVIMMMT